MTQLRIFLLLSGATFVLGTALFLLVPAAHPWILEEDNWVENLTAAIFLIAGLVCLASARTPDREIRSTALVLSGCGFLGFLDEISFGERLFGLTMPELYGEKIDAAHDFVYVAARIGKSFATDHTPLFLAAAAVAGAAGVALVFWPGRKLFAAAAASRLRETYLLTAVAAGLLCASQLIDFEKILIDLLFAWEELFELNAGVALVCAGLAIRGTGADGPGTTTGREGA